MGIAAPLVEKPDWIQVIVGAGLALPKAVHELLPLKKG